MPTYDVWIYREQTDIGYDPVKGRDLTGLDLTGFQVEAVDGSIGKIDEANNEVGNSYLIVDTGPWIFGKKVMLPAGVVQRIDEAEERVWVNRTKEQIKNAPEFDETGFTDGSYHDELGAYYGQGGQGFRD
jgi:hypothetical protein